MNLDKNLRNLRTKPAERRRERTSGKSGRRHKQCSIERLLPTTRSGISSKAKRTLKMRLSLSCLVMTLILRPWKLI
jgi:hypothetical protein